LLKLDNSGIADQGMTMQTDDVRDQVRKAKKKLSTKKRRYLQLLKTNPQRVENPPDLTQFQI
jgi:hypothetical protein